MKSMKIKTLLLAASTITVLCGCGGTTVNATVGGTVNGLSGGTTVVLTDNGSDPISVGANGAFTFDVQIASNSSYKVAVLTNPIGEICAVSNGSGEVNGDGDEITNVVISCVTTQ
jgi:hypothetical protein